MPKSPASAIPPPALNLDEILQQLRRIVKERSKIGFYLLYCSSLVKKY
jgi:hypothetical protein